MFNSGTKKSKSLNTTTTGSSSRNSYILTLIMICLNLFTARGTYTLASQPWSSFYTPACFKPTAPPWLGTVSIPKSPITSPSLSLIYCSQRERLRFPSTVLPATSQPTWPSRRLAVTHRSPSSPLHCKILALFTMITNFQSRYTMGNRKNKGIKISHWNKGGSYLINKMPEIKNIIAQHKPQILGISEANLLDTHDPSLVAVQDYCLHVCSTISNPCLRTSRVVVYTHKDIVAKLRPDLMSDMYSSIWLEVGLPNQKRFLVSQSYREWQYTNQRGNRISSTIPEQLSRWHLFLDQYETALATGMEVHCLGDLNLNHCNWTDSNSML